MSWERCGTGAFYFSLENWIDARRETKANVSGDDVDGKRKYAYFDKSVSLFHLTVHSFLKIPSRALPFLDLETERIAVERYSMYLEMFSRRYAFRFTRVAMASRMKIPRFKFTRYRDARRLSSRRIKANRSNWKRFFRYVDGKRKH